MAGKTLEAKEELFAQDVARGFTASAAYRNHYSTENMQANTVHNEASRLRHKSEVSHRIAELKELAAEQAIVDTSMVLRGLLSEAENIDEGASHSARVAAWAHLGKHLGMFTDKVDHTSSDGSMSPPQDLTVEVAKAISKKLDDDY